MRSNVSRLSRRSWKSRLGRLYLSAYFLAVFLAAFLLTFLAAFFFFFAVFFAGCFFGGFLGFGLGFGFGFGLAKKLGWTGRTSPLSAPGSGLFELGGISCRHMSVIFAT